MFKIIRNTISAVSNFMEELVIEQKAYMEYKKKETEKIQAELDAEIKKYQLPGETTEDTLKRMHNELIEKLEQLKL